ncbi:MAG: ribonuclease R [Pseudomonadota bacterium]
MKDFPSKGAILDWIHQNPDAQAKRDIARAFGIKGADRVELKRVLRELEDDGQIQRRARRVRPPGHLPPVAVLIASAPDADGDIWAEPKEREHAEAPPPILYLPRKGDPALGPGDPFLAKLRPAEGAERLTYEARLIKKLPGRPRRMLGVYRETTEGGRLLPVDKKDGREWFIQPGADDGAEDGELVEAEAVSGPRMGLPRGRIVERLGKTGGARSVSLIAMRQHGIEIEFPAEVEAAAEAATPPGADGREDLRALPLLTIDPADARDHDDAVAAMPDGDPSNPGGHIIWVAIADVAWYVRPGTALDREARRRGNSTYFPDRVAPMLPERLSADLCSLHEAVDRPCLAVRMVLNAAGEKISHRFVRGIMRSGASLTYEQAQALADNGAEPGLTAAHGDTLTALFAAYRAVAAARDRRQPLSLDLPERQIALGVDGEVESIRFRERLDAHRLIEEFMILANVAAAETLEGQRQPRLYRVHEEPNPDKLEALAESVESVGLTLAKGQVLTTAHLNRLLDGAAGSPHAEMVHLSVLRSQTQAYYAPENFGHFGLNLKRYTHFTSPIRRYADLAVHRALIAAAGLGPGGQAPEEAETLQATAEHISRTERVSMEAERDTADRYLAAYLEDRTGAVFPGRINGVARFGLFVRLEETGADGLVPVSTLGTEFFRHDAQSQTLTGERSGTVLGIGLTVQVRLIEAAPITGGLIFELLEVTGADGRPVASGKGRFKGTPRRKLARARIKQAKDARAARRKRR